MFPSYASLVEIVSTGRTTVDGPQCGTDRHGCFFNLSFNLLDQDKNHTQTTKPRLFYGNTLILYESRYINKYEMSAPAIQGTSSLDQNNKL